MTFLAFFDIQNKTVDHMQNGFKKNPALLGFVLFLVTHTRMERGNGSKSEKAGGGKKKGNRKKRGANLTSF